jgi:hypothetical protein
MYVCMYVCMYVYCKGLCWYNTDSKRSQLTDNSIFGSGSV